MNTTTLALLFATATQTFELPDGLLSAVCFYESSHRVNVVRHNDGKSSSIGVCQVKLATAQMLGFKGTAEQLKQPQYNVYYAAKYMRKQLDRYDWHLDKAIAAYNSGTFKAGKSTFAANQSYVDNVLKCWDEGR